MTTLLAPGVTRRGEVCNQPQLLRRAAELGRGLARCCETGAARG